jgi:nucleoid-associated protein YgaU
VTSWSRLVVVASLLVLLPVGGATPALAEQAQPVVHEDPVCAFDGTACVGTLHVVARGEWLWKIARAELVRQGHSSRNAADVRAYVAKIYATNRPAIGRDPHRLRTGTRLVLPPAR